MRAIRVDAEMPNDRTGERLELYGPVADLSGVDVTAPVASVQVSPEASSPAYGRRGYGRYAYGQLDRYSGVGRMPYGRTAYGRPPRLLSVQTPRRYEYGVIPVGLKTADALGLRSSLATVDVLIVSTPQPHAGSRLAETDKGRMQLTITEWPNG
jgi:hypothetical protein